MIDILPYYNQETKTFNFPSDFNEKLESGKWTSVDSYFKIDVSGNYSIYLDYKNFKSKVKEYQEKVLCVEKFLSEDKNFLQNKEVYFVFLLTIMIIVIVILTNY